MPKARKINNSNSTMEKLLAKKDVSLTNLVQGELVEGIVVSVGANEVLVDVGAKSEGIISNQELEEGMDLKQGDTIFAKVVQTEDRQGYVVLSAKRAEKEKSWSGATKAFEEGLVLDAVIIEYNKGGLLCDCEGLRGFIPLSHLDRVHFTDDVAKVSSGSENELKESLQVLAGKSLKVKVIEIDKEKNRFVLSEKDALGTYTTEAKQERLEEIKIGDMVAGVVTGIMPFGIFVDLDGVEGLVHISEIAWEKVNHPGEYFSVGQNIDVEILGVDDNTKKLALSVKRLISNPWEQVEEKYPVDAIVDGEVSKIVPFGAFINLEKGLDGLVHISETDGPLEIGDKVKAIVTQVDGAKQKLALSIRLLKDESKPKTDKKS